MWTYTALILDRYCSRDPKKYDELPFSELNDFVFTVLWKKHKVVFHEDAEDLFRDLRYLEKIGIVEIRNSDDGIGSAKLKVKDRERLAKVAKVVEGFGALTKVELLDEYVERINEAVEDFFRSKE